MWQVLAGLVVLVVMAWPVRGEDYSRIALSIELMELCKNDGPQCELVAGLVKDNIIFSYKLGSALSDDWQSSLSQLLAVPGFHCIDSVTPAQMRQAINDGYGKIGVAATGAHMMLFNALGAAAAYNCEPEGA